MKPFVTPSPGCRTAADLAKYNEGAREVWTARLKTLRAERVSEIRAQETGLSEEQIQSRANEFIEFARIGRRPQYVAKPAAVQLLSGLYHIDFSQPVPEVEKPPKRKIASPNDLPDDWVTLAMIANVSKFSIHKWQSRIQVFYKAQVKKHQPSQGDNAAAYVAAHIVGLKCSNHAPRAWAVSPQGRKLLEQAYGVTIPSRAEIEAQAVSQLNR